jgi:hypothetical protein
MNKITWLVMFSLGLLVATTANAQEQMLVPNDPRSLRGHLPRIGIPWPRCAARAIRAARDVH